MGHPEYQLPYERLDADIAVIEAMGVEIRCNTWVGRDIGMSTSCGRFRCGLLGLGLCNSAARHGSPAPTIRRVLKAVEVLRRITDGSPFTVPRSPSIGGGNVAMDAARSLARLQRQDLRRGPGHRQCTEDFDHFLADPERSEIPRGRHPHPAQPGPRHASSRTVNWSA